MRGEEVCRIDSSERDNRSIPSPSTQIDALRWDHEALRDSVLQIQLKYIASSYYGAIMVKQTAPGQKERRERKWIPWLMIVNRKVT